MLCYIALFGDGSKKGPKGSGLSCHMVMQGSPEANAFPQLDKTLTVITTETCDLDEQKNRCRQENVTKHGKGDTGVRILSASPW